MVELANIVSNKFIEFTNVVFSNWSINISPQEECVDVNLRFVNLSK